VEKLQTLKSFTLDLSGSNPDRSNKPSNEAFFYLNLK